MLTLSDLAPVLNDIIMPSVKTQLYHKAPLWQLLGGWQAEQDGMPVASRANKGITYDFENNQFKVPIRTGMHSGIVGIDVGEKYNNGKPQLKTTYQTPKTIVGAFQIPKRILNITDAGAVVAPLMFNSDTLTRDMAVDLNRQMHGSGNGAVAKTNATVGVASTALVLAASTNGDRTFAKYLPIGSRIKIASNAITTVTAHVGVNSVTLADAQTWSAGDLVYKVNMSDAVSSEIDGLGAMLAASGAYQNLNSSDAPSWAAKVDSTSETVTPTTIQQKMNAIFFQANATGNVKWIVMNAKAFQIYGASLTSQIQQNPKQVLSGGWLGLDYMGGNAQILLDYDNPDDTIKFLTLDDLIFAQQQGLEWEKGTDGVLFRIAGQLDYEAVCSWTGNIATHSRASQGLLSGKTFSYS